MSNFEPLKIDLEKMTKNQLAALDALDSELKTLTATRMGRRAFMQAMPLLLAACASGDKTRYREGNNKGQETTLSVADEKRMTKEVLPKMRKDYPAHKNKEAQKYIKSLGAKIVKANKLNKNPYVYNFTLVDVNYVNAFALPAGEIMVTAPLLAMAETEAELSGVIGHEIGHVISRHTAERMDAAEKAQKKSWLYAVGGGLLGGVGGFALGKLLCQKSDPEYKKCLQRAAAYGAAAGAGGGLLIQKYAFMANSREDEMEADRVGFRTSVAAGYHKDHVGTFYSKLLEMEKKHKGGSNKLMASIADAMSTHPPSQERVNQMNEMASKENAKKGSVISTKAFDRIKKSIA
ncbi:MAG: M48 family metalloprotease [Halobacteriovoraceae bacterium]|nr:M48 family metalloprotease [Halobacteriovoraceae bacterium]MCB9095692.1 M48 family metalloprotease [Halobacteriovoraceae bacterium]